MGEIERPQARCDTSQKGGGGGNRGQGDGWGSWGSCGSGDEVLGMRRRRTSSGCCSNVCASLSLHGQTRRTGNSAGTGVPRPATPTACVIRGRRPQGPRPRPRLRPRPWACVRAAVACRHASGFVSPCAVAGQRGHLVQGGWVRKRALQQLRGGTLSDRRRLCVHAGPVPTHVRFSRRHGRRARIGTR